MTKIWIWLLLLLLSCSLFACAPQVRQAPQMDAPGSDLGSLECTVLEVYGDRLLVYGRHERDLYEIPLTDPELASGMVFAKGERLRIQYAGPVQEVYPARIPYPLKIEKIN